jgi:hypothetical protein
MAGQLTIDTLRAGSGVLATQNGMTGIAKAWVQFSGVTTVTINGSFNVSSVTRNSTGDYTVNFTTSMPTANFATVATGQNSAATANGTIVNIVTRATGSVRVYYVNIVEAARDGAEQSVVVIGA